MAQPYVGEIRMFAGNFAPVGWLFCDGQLLPISENETLFQLIGTTYGGDGQETFALPNLQSRVPLHQGNGFIMAQAAGVEEVTLSVQQIPAHTHPLLCSSGTASGQDPTNGVPAVSTAQAYFNSPANPTNLAPASVGPVGGSQPHTNLQPYLCINFIISLFGIFPSQT
ncbi:MAG TPA: tail fiber protein [Pyrinomonadaceae bacterium]|nr:tail fiber protein [Pyrinomonadaceae bacterium]